MFRYRRQMRKSFGVLRELSASNEHSLPKRGTSGRRRSRHNGGSLRRAEDSGLLVQIRRSRIGSRHAEENDVVTARLVVSDTSLFVFGIISLNFICSANFLTRY